MKLLNPRPYRILICNSNPNETAELSTFLKEQNYETAAAYTDRQALDQLVIVEFDIVLLDIGLPRLLESNLFQQLIVHKDEQQIILLSEETPTDDMRRIWQPLSNHYWIKPLDFSVVAADLEQILKAKKQQTPNHYNRYFETGGLVLDHENQTVTVDGKLVNLTASEYNILLYLMANKGRIVSTKEIYEALWETEVQNSDNVITVHICHIRKKIEEDPNEPKYLKMLWGKGYRIEDL
ncbi:MAG TPA: response regulator transcription factor [Clostridiaceae bacterium]|nr:response regulator transcription factor [Clostridiaceae bacterium]